VPGSTNQNHSAISNVEDNISGDNVADALPSCFFDFLIDKKSFNYIITMIQSYNDRLIDHMHVHIIAAINLSIIWSSNIYGLSSEPLFNQSTKQHINMRFSCVCVFSLLLVLLLSTVQSAVIPRRSAIVDDPALYDRSGNPLTPTDEDMSISQQSNSSTQSPTRRTNNHIAEENEVSVVESTLQTTDQTTNPSTDAEQDPIFAGFFPEFDGKPHDVIENDPKSADASSGSQIDAVDTTVSNSAIQKSPSPSDEAPSSSAPSVVKTTSTLTDDQHQVHEITNSSAVNMTAVMVGSIVGFLFAGLCVCTIAYIWYRRYRKAPTKYYDVTNCSYIPMPLPAARSFATAETKLSCYDAPADETANHSQA
jgi:hypothetical protein